MPKEQNICKSDGCNNKKIKNRTICGKCKLRRYREKSPIKSSYQNLRSNAKRRGKIFTISFEYFSKFAVETEYIYKKGRTKLGYTIDCIKEELGYVEGNIRSIPNTDNVKKQRRKEKILKYDHQHKVAFFKEVKPFEDTDNDIPF